MTYQISAVLTEKMHFTVTNRYDAEIRGFSFAKVIGSTMPEINGESDLVIEILVSPDYKEKKQTLKFSKYLKSSRPQEERALVELFLSPLQYEAMLKSDSGFFNFEVRKKERVEKTEHFIHRHFELYTFEISTRLSRVWGSSEIADKEKN